MLKILCLHGKQQNKEVLRTRLGNIPKKLKKIAQLTIIDSPHSDGFIGDNVPVRTWFERDDEGNINGESLEVSIAEIKRVWTESGPFDGILGFSMGGTLAALLSSQEYKESFTSLRFGIYIGAPNVPPKMLLAAQKEEIRFSETFPSLHIAGKTDAVVSIESSRALSTRFTNPVWIEHEQGHCIPMKAEMMNHILTFVTAQIKENVVTESDDI